MKKFGFTLAELLVTLSIIGIITAMAIPSLSLNTQNKANAAKLSATITLLETAFSNMMADEGVVDIYEISDWSTKIHNYLNATENATDTDNGSFIKEAYPDVQNGYLAKTIDGDTFLTYSQLRADFPKVIITKNGVYVFVKSIDNEIVIDVAKGKPNVVGRDVFKFYLHEDGKLHAFGSKSLQKIKSTTGHWKEDTGDYGCNNSSKKVGCTARLVENNFVVDY